MHLTEAINANVQPARFFFFFTHITGGLISVGTYELFSAAGGSQLASLPLTRRRRSASGRPVNSNAYCSKARLPDEINFTQAFAKINCVNE